jgi:protein-L-isoaspartate O-methyltransferase
MQNKSVNIILKYSRKIFYEVISPKFKKDLLKGMMDFLYILFEKIAIKFNIISLNYIKLYSDIVQKEIMMAEINSKDSIIIIGCGTLPSTSILISMKTKAKIVAIDRDIKAIKRANIFLSNIYNNKIILEYANGLNYPIHKFDVIMILYGVTNLKQIFNYLYQNMKSDARVIVRTNEEKKNSYFYKFNISDKVESKYLGQIYSYLLKKP